MSELDADIAAIDRAMISGEVTDEARFAWRRRRGELRKRGTPSATMRAVTEELQRVARESIATEDPRADDEITRRLGRPR